jgi:hypothetical protein
MQRYALAALALVVVSWTLSTAIASADVGIEVPEEPSSAYVAASAALGGLNLTTTFLNLKPQTSEGSPGWSGFTGLFGGMLGIGLGSALLFDHEYEDGTPLAITNIAVDAFSTAVGVSAILRSKKAPAEEHAGAEPHSVTFSPVVHFGRVSGVGLGMRF